MLLSSSQLKTQTQTNGSIKGPCISLHRQRCLEGHGGLWVHILPKRRGSGAADIDAILPRHDPSNTSRIHKRKRAEGHLQVEQQPKHGGGGVVVCVWGGGGGVMVVGESDSVL